MIKWCLVSATIVAAACLYGRYRDSFHNLEEPLAAGRGVVFYDRLRANPGYNLVEIYSVPWGKPRCRIMDMDGNVVMTLPGSNCELLSSGGFISNVERDLIYVGPDLKERWRVPEITVRHDIFEDRATREILLWADAFKPIEPKMPFANAQKVAGSTLLINELLGFSPDGVSTFKWSAWDRISDLEWITKERGRALELTLESKGIYEFSHFNSIDVLPGNRWSSASKAFQKGNILTTSTKCGCVAIISRETGEVLWYYRTEKDGYYRTHSAHWLENDNILFYKNSRDDLEAEDKFSEVIELRPTDQRIVWSYRAPSPGRFYGSYLGAAYRLPNGNTLITSLANGGNAFEVTPSGRLVWEWSNSQASPLFPGSIYRVRRIPSHLVEALLSVPRPMTVGIPDPFFEP